MPNKRAAQATLWLALFSYNIPTEQMAVVQEATSLAAWKAIMATLPLTSSVAA